MLILLLTWIFTWYSSRNMPPKGSKGRKPAGSASEGNDGGPKIDEPVSSPIIPEGQGTSPGKAGEGDSDSSELNEEDSFKILKKNIIKSENC